jgi:carboxymethylenebutenolidase
VPRAVYPTPHGNQPGYLAVPEGAGPWPGVVVVHEVFGLNDDIRRIADRFAATGYVALAPDLYAGGFKLGCIMAAFRQLRARQGTMFDDLEAARQVVAGRPDSTGQVGVIGFCMGGGFALAAAPRGSFGAASVNYAHVPGDAEQLLKGACPVVGSYGARDRTMPGAAHRLDMALAVDGVPRDVKEYPEAGHSFMNHHDGPVFWVLGKVMGAGYHGPSAEDAWTRILAFFGEHLRKIV